MNPLSYKLSYKLSASDLDLILALARGGSLSKAGAHLAQDPSTVFRSLTRVEKGLGQRLFERLRSGYTPSDLALGLIAHAEQIESQLDHARQLSQGTTDSATGLVRIATVDSILHHLLSPALQQLQRAHPALQFDIRIGNELASLTRRDADIAIRATQTPPEHLIGKRLGTIQFAAYAATASGITELDAATAERAQWISTDDALPNHPGVVWRKKMFPKVSPSYRVNSVLSVTDLVASGLGIGVMPIFLAKNRADLTPLTGPIKDCTAQLWLLTHVESRHLHRVSTVYQYLSQHIAV